LCALLHVVEQAGVLDRNGRLTGEGLDEGNLFVGKWSYLQVIDHHHA
jgi:hypothetical protein